MLRRGAFSPNIKERADCSAAVFDAAGRCSPRPSTSRCTWGRCRRRSHAVIDELGELGPGEQAIVNDPFAGGTHLNDVTVVAPVLARRRLVGWVANRAHHADLGGAAPGSMPADATDIHQEGLRLPPDAADRRGAGAAARELAHAGRARRRPGRAAGRQRRRGRPTGAAGRRAVRRGRRLRRAAHAGPRSPALPDGEWIARTDLDSTGAATDQQRRGAAALHGADRRATGSSSTSPAPRRSDPATPTRCVR